MLTTEDREGSLYCCRIDHSYDEILIFGPAHVCETLVLGFVILLLGGCIGTV